MAITTMSMSLGGEPRRYSSGGLSLEEAAQESYRIRGEYPPSVEEKPEEDTRSPAQIYMDNQRAREKKAEQEALNSVPSANDVLALKGSEQMQIRMDVGEQIMAALPGKGIWDVKDNRPVFFTSDGKEFDGTDVVNSAGAVENFIAATLGEEYRAIYSRSITAPLDPAYRLQENAKGASNPVLAQMQEQGTISQDFSDSDIGVVSESAATGVASELKKAAPALLEKGISPADLMIQFGARLNDSKEFKELPDAAKVAVVRDLAERIDEADSIVVSKTLNDILNQFNQVEQDAEKEIAKTVADTILDDFAPVDSFERASLLKQTMDGAQEIRTLAKTIYAFPPEKVLDTPWEIRQKKIDTGKVDIEKLKKTVAQVHSRALRDQPKAVVDEATAALFDIDRDLISEGLSLDKLVSSLEDTGIDLAVLSDGDRRKFLLGRAIDKWFVANSKDPASAPVYSSLRQKMLKTVAEGGKLDPNIENSVSGLVRQINVLEERKRSLETAEGQAVANKLTTKWNNLADTLKRTGSIIDPKEKTPLTLEKDLDIIIASAKAEVQGYDKEVQKAVLEPLEKLRAEQKVKKSVGGVLKSWILTGTRWDENRIAREQQQNKPQPFSFKTSEEALAAGLPSGTIVLINGRRARID